MRIVYNGGMESLELNSRGYFLWNNDLGVMISGQNEDVQVPVASLTKIMTALVVLERREMNEEVTINSEMLAGLEEFAKLGLRVGQKVTVEDLLHATMLPSAGDAAQALAVSTAGSIAGFAEMMNARAAEMGLSNTHFSNAVGMDEENYSTPRDMAMLVREALRNEKFVEIFEIYEWKLATGETVRKTFTQTGAIKGGKTGFTNAAGRCLASTAEVEGTEYILVTVGAPTVGTLHVVDTETVYRAVEENYEPTQIVREGEELVLISVRGSEVEEMKVLAKSDATVALENGLTQDELSYEYDGVTEITRKTEVGTKLGSFVIKQGEQVLYEQEVYLDTEMEFYNYGLVALGGGVSLAMLLVAVLGVWRMQKKKAGVKILAAIGVVGFLVSLVVNAAVFWGWFRDTGEFEVKRPEMITGQEESTVETVESETVDPTPAVASVDTEKSSGNCTTGWGNLMLINPNFKVGTDFIAARKNDLVSVSATYGIPEYNRGTNGDNLLMPEAAEHLNEMVRAYEAAYSGHTMGTRSCFRAKGTSCGRLCAATGTSDHHTGLTCDLIDNAYGTSLDTGDYTQHVEWQWLRENSYKYGFIDRFPEAWAGGLMSEPLNVDVNGTTGLYETWHYRYVGVEAATEIAMGKYNGGKYDSLEHYLKATGRVEDLKNGVCAAL